MKKEPCRQLTASIFRRALGLSRSETLQASKLYPRDREALEAMVWLLRSGQALGTVKIVAPSDRSTFVDACIFAVIQRSKGGDDWCEAPHAVDDTAPGVSR